MTREEAIKILKEIDIPTNGDNEKERNMAFNMAFKALKQEPKTGHWILGVCDNCMYDWSKDAPIASVPNFCPNCGAKMVEPQESEGME